MTEPEFPSVEIPAMDDRQIQFLSSLNSVFKEYPDQMQSLSKTIDFFLQTCSPRSNDVEENSRRKMQRELEEIKDKLPKKAEDMVKKDEEITDIERQREEDNRKMEFELQEMTKEGKELAKTKNNTMKADGQREEEYQKINLLLREAKEKISQMEGEIIEKDKKIKEMENQSKDVGKMQRELEEVKDKLSKRVEDIAKKDRDIKEIDKKRRDDSSKMSDQLESVQNEMESYKSSFSKVSVELKSVQMQMESYKSRLASLSEKNVQQDQRKVEDISGSNRPSELEKDFCAFFDDDRVDACLAMQSEYSHNDGDFVDIYYPRLACLILETAYEQAKEVHEAFSHTFKEITTIMMNYSPLLGQEMWTARKLHMEGNWPNNVYTFYFNTPLWGEGSDSLKDVVDEMHLAMKEVAPTCNVETLTQVIAQISYMKWEKWCVDDETCKFSPCANIIQALGKYIFACIKLTWRMVTQMPPMKLEYHCSQFNKDIHRKVSRGQEGTRRLSKKDQGEDIIFYLWPGLQDGGGRRIRHAEVLCKVK